ncbi:MAG: hypothetical protein NZ455_01075 [Bacteroidia bacterium]|nr:hypothetical protein [Bacteroidia bacterium]MDW8347642.1 hypothetical protein [Bacteroidia bacterium]
MLRATLTLRCFAALRTAYAPSACLTHAAFGCFTLFLDMSSLYLVSG